MLEKVAGSLGNLLKLILLAALVCAASFFAWKYRGTIGQALAQLWRDIQQLLASLWGGRRQPVGGDEASQASQPSAPPLPSFASYTDPFLSGAAERLTTEQLIRYSFEALEAWGREQGCARKKTRRRSSLPSASPVATTMSAPRLKCSLSSTVASPTDTNGLCPNVATISAVSGSNSEPRRQQENLVPQVPIDSGTRVGSAWRRHQPFAMWCNRFAVLISVSGTSRPLMLSLVPQIVAVRPFTDG